jgi:hypothetical protein
MDQTSGDTSLTSNQIPEKLAFDFIKSQHFRVITATGMIGGPTPQGQIAVSLYNERAPIPTRIVHALTPEGALGSEIEAEREVRDSILREVEFCMVLDHDTAVKMSRWLSRAANQLAELHEQHSSDSQDQTAEPQDKPTKEGEA